MVLFMVKRDNEWSRRNKRKTKQNKFYFLTALYCEPKANQSPYLSCSQTISQGVLWEDCKRHQGDMHLLISFFICCFSFLSVLMSGSCRNILLSWSGSLRQQFLTKGMECFRCMHFEDAKLFHFLHILNKVGHLKND